MKAQTDDGWYGVQRAAPPVMLTADDQLVVSQKYWRESFALVLPSSIGGADRFPHSSSIDPDCINN